MATDYEIRDDPINWVITQVARFPKPDKKKTREITEPTRELVFCTRLIRVINEELNETPYKAGRGLLFFGDDERTIQEVDAVIYDIDHEDLVYWDGDNRHENFEICITRPTCTKIIIECKKDISLSNHNVWNKLKKQCPKLRGLGIPLWLVAEECSIDNINDKKYVNKRAFGEPYFFNRVYVLKFRIKKPRTDGEEIMPGFQWEVLTKALGSVCR